MSRGQEELHKTENKALWKGAAYTFTLRSGFRRGGAAPTGETAKLLNLLLQRTLCDEPSGRYESCAELIAAIDLILSLQSPREPRLKKNMPAAQRDFVGRESQLQALEQKLREGSGPVFVSGMAGMGKTELVLCAAEKLKNDFDFYYMPFTRTLRESLAALPAENLPESVREDGEGRAALLLEHLKSLDRRTVLVIDNFDAADESRSPALVNEPLFAELCRLPVRLVFTSRHHFAGFDSIELGPLEAQELESLCAALLPGEDAGELARLCEALNRHTLSVSIAAKSLAAGGRGGVKELCRRLDTTKIRRGEKDTETALALLRTLLSTQKTDGDSRWLMGFFCLVPTSGVSADLLCALLDEKRWACARKLRDSGWLRHDAATERWSIHPLTERLFMGEKRLRPDRESFEGLTGKLRELEGRCTDAEISAQIEAIYANFSRKAVGRRKGRTAAAIALGLGLLAAAAGISLSAVLRWREVNADPVQRQFESAVVQLTVGSTEDVEKSLAAEDLAKLNARLQLIAGDKKLSFLVGDDGYYHVSLPLNRFIERGGDLDYVLEHCLVYDGEIFFLNTESYNASSFNDPTGLEFEIVSSAVEYVDRYGEQSFLSAARPHLELYVPDEKLSMAEENVGPREIMGLAYKNERIETVDVEGDENRFILNEPELTKEGVLEAQIHCFMNAPLNGDYSYYYSVTPEAIWEVPEDTERPGSRQVKREAMGSATLTASFTHHSPEDLSEHEFAQERSKLIRRLEALELDYALGAATADSRKLVVCLPDTVGGDCLKLICASDIYFNSGKTRFFSGDAFMDADSAEIRKTGEGGFALALDFSHSDNSYAREDYETFLDHARFLQPAELHLCTEYLGEPLLWGSFDLRLAEEESLIVFDRLWHGDRSLSGEQLPLLRMLEYVVGSDSYIGYNLADWHYNSPEAGRSEEEHSRDELLLLRFAEGFEGVELRFEEGVDARFIVEGPTDMDTVRRGMDMAAQLLDSVALKDTGLDSIHFDFGRGEGVCRLCIDVGALPYNVSEEDSIAMGVAPGYLSFAGVCRGGPQQAIFADFVTLFREMDFAGRTGVEKWGLDGRDSCNLYLSNDIGFSIVGLYSKEADAAMDKTE